MIDPVIEQLWCGWRNAYVANAAAGLSEGERPTSSVFSRILASGVDDEDALIVHRGETCFAILNRFPYTSGHTLVLPYREIADLEQLDGPETAELWTTVTRLVTVLKTVYRPSALNVGINLGEAAGGSIAQHLHVHVVPRWVGDANFMTATASTRTLPEALPDSWRKIRAAWQVSSEEGAGSAG